MQGADARRVSQRIKVLISSKGYNENYETRVGRYRGLCRYVGEWDSLSEVDATRQRCPAATRDDLSRLILLGYLTATIALKKKRKKERKKKEKQEEGKGKKLFISLYSVPNH